ncbi:MAG: membrane integrity-associated transporter subunit PqiC [Planctomycetes bacterium]|nr:membrane integrity-associated transporter subunit PqiC [Planctomycetota bacterium]
MNPIRGLVVLPLLCAACLSPQPAAPAARVFDPRPAMSPPKGKSGPLVRVEAPAHLGVEFVLRTAADEVVFDGEHRWVMPPAELVVATLQRRLGAPPVPRLETAREALELHLVLDRFELDVAGEPKARIVVFARPSDGWRLEPITVECPARDRSPEALAAAMQQALLAVGRWAGGD